MPALRQYAIAALVLVVGGVVAIALWVWSGIYNVSAARDHFEVVEWVLDIGRRQSVRFHSAGVGPPPDLDDRDRLILGARHFDSGCAPCHGAPGRRASALNEAMLPEPPPLDGLPMDWSDQQVFWIVRNGQKYTGMPHWLAPEREDEVWSVVAFVRQLQGMESAEYAALAGVADGDTDASFAPQQGQDSIVAACIGCHGAPGEAPPSLLVPQLAGQNASYLERSLRAYRDDIRPSGIMQLFANYLEDELIKRISAAYSDAEPALLRADHRPPRLVERGAVIVATGIPDKEVPPCSSCHGVSPRYPTLFGLSAKYVDVQLRVFRAGERDGTPYGGIMTAVAKRLSDDDVAALAAYVGSLSSARPDNREAASDDKAGTPSSNTTEGSSETPTGASR